MFADELKGGDAARRRAEETKARRLRLKEQQEQKKKALAAAAAAAAAFGTNATPATAAAPVAITSSSMDSAKPLMTGLSALSVTRQVAVASHEPSAVERAQQGRRIRQDAARRAAAAVRIQAQFRRRHHVALLQTAIRHRLSQQLSDLETLREIIRESKRVEYAPPPATTRLLCTELIFLSTVRSESMTRLDLGNNYDLLRLLLDNALLPGLSHSDPSLNPFLTWLDAPEGRLRLQRLIRLCLLLINSHGNRYDSATSFLTDLIVGNTSTGGGDVAQLLLTTHSRQAMQPQTTYPPFALDSASLDIISILRYHLMYTVAASPIPAVAKDLREGCIPLEKRRRAGAFLIMVLQAVEAAATETFKLALQARLALEILTVPLLVWKVSPETSSYLISVDSSGSSTVLACLDALIRVHSSQLAAGKLNDLLAVHEVPLLVCPATSTQCFLANLVQLMHMSPSMNGTKPLDVVATTLHFDVLATLVDIIPLATFSSRDSTVEWIADDKGHHSAVVLSPIVLDQCRLLLVDSFVRRLFQKAIDIEALKTDRILSQMNEKDMKHERELQEEGGSSSAVTMAAKEARIDRNRGFWNSSKWALKLTASVTSLLSTEGKADFAVNKKDTKGGNLLNTSSVSKKLASGEKDVTISMEKTVSINNSKRPYDISLLLALCRTYGIVLARWGGGGREDMIASRREDQAVAVAKPETCALSLLNLLCFSTRLLKASWGIIQSECDISTKVNEIIDPDQGKTPPRMLSARPSYSTPRSPHRLVQRSESDGAIMLYVFVCTLSHTLIVTDDTEIYDMGRPLPLHQLRRCIQVFKKLLYRVCCYDDTTTVPNYFGLSLISACSTAMKDLYDRSSRRPLCAPKLWLIPDLLDKEIRHGKGYEDYVALLKLPVLRICPQLVSFKRRLKLFERIVVTNRISIQGTNDGNPFNSNPLKPGIPVFITRGRLLEDGLATMNNLGSRMRQRISVQYINEAGTRETGVDAGGLFKEFWSDLCALAFRLDYALFTITEGTGCMYPNPSSFAAHGSDHTQLFAFVGRILGKALYEGITIQPKFAHFFLSFLRGDYNYLHMLPDLSTVDPQLYNNLMFLKTYDGDASDLCLSFTVTNQDFGDRVENPLIPNGANIEVTNANKHRYIGLVAKHYVVDRIKEQSEAFTCGLWEVIDRAWLRIFNEPELQVLISGASDGKIDVDDMRANTRYVGGYVGMDRNIVRFWNVVKSFSPREQAELLRFVTSCERPPPLGFASMNPPFTIQRVGILRDGDKLPSASTCFNILKLPTYSSEKVLKERLLYAIKSGAGFELT